MSMQAQLDYILPHVKVILCKNRPQTNEVTLTTLGFKEMTNSIFKDQNNLKKDTQV